MEKILRLEEAGLFLLSLFLFSTTGYSWWLYLLLFLAPDLSMVGYLFSAPAGAVLYNVFHHQGLAVVVFMAGGILAVPVLQVAGAILLGHSALDRIFGFGLKYPDSFHNTHLGFLNKR